MHKKRFAPLQAFGLVAAIMVLVSGVTFAALRSQGNAINGSRITSASASLQMAHQNDGTWYNSMNGYDFFDLLPGGEPGPKTGNNLYLKNAGTTTLNIAAVLNPNQIYNPNQVNVGKVRLVLTNDAGAKVASPSLGELWDGFNANKEVSLGITIPAGSVQHYKVQMQLEDGAVTNNTSQASIENINLVLTGLVATT